MHVVRRSVEIARLGERSRGKPRDLGGSAPTRPTALSTGANYAHDSAARRAEANTPLSHLITDAIFQCLCGCEYCCAEQLASGDVRITQRSVVRFPGWQPAIAHRLLEPTVQS